MRTAAFISILIFIAFSSVIKAQNETFEELFKTAFECEDCSDSLRLELFTNVIDHGVSDIKDLDNFQNALVNRATILMEMRKYKKAIEDLNLAFSVAPDYLIRQKLGTSYLGNGEYEKAIHEYDQYLKHVEYDQIMDLMRYDSSQTARDNVSMQETLEEMRDNSIAESNKDLSISYNNRGIAKGYLGNHDGACADFRNAYKTGMIELKSFIENRCFQSAEE